jgi:peptidoglycan/xylan/chitin deacetylase (PgdA/CDA1 family)
MRSRTLGAALALSWVITTSASVFAQGQSDTEAFAWPTQQWADAAETQAPPSTSPTPIVVRKGPRRSGAVALTFDDGYNRTACARIANTLRRSDAVGTFFVNGQYLRTAPSKWRRILEGMEVGNHTRSHPDLTREPHPVVIRQIAQNEAIHEQVLGRPMLKALRPPYGAYSERVGRIAAQLGYEHIAMWNVDMGDWRPGTKAGAIVRRAIGAPAGSIILMHCGHNATAKALPRIVRHYQRRGIELTGLSAVLEGARDTRGSPKTRRYDR